MKNTPILLITLAIFLSGNIAYCQKEISNIRKGNRDYNKEDFHKAEINYRKALETNPLQNTAEFNLGNALYKQDNYKDATTSYMATVARTGDNKTKASALYNLGNSFYKEQKYPEAIAAYKESLKCLPTDDARYNLVMAQKQNNKENKDSKDQQQGQQQEKNQQQQQGQDQQQQQRQDQQQQQGQDQQQQQRQDQQQQEQNQQQGQEQQESKDSKEQGQKISEEDAERILEALKNEEKQTITKILQDKNKGQKVKIEKDW